MTDLTLTHRTKGTKACFDSEKHESMDVPPHSRMETMEQLILNYTHRGSDGNNF